MAHAEQTGEGLGFLLSGLATDVSGLFRKEIELAKAEASETVDNATRAGRNLAIGAVLAIGALGVFLAAALVRVLAHPHGTVGTVVDAFATVALVVWAGDEIVRGVNPWRRILGGTVLVFVVAGLVSS